MGWFTEIVIVVSMLAIAIEVHLLRKAYRDGSRGFEHARDVELGVEPIPDKSMPAVLKEIAESLADRVVGPTLPRVMTEEDEFNLEQRSHFTMGAQAGYQVSPWWTEQEEREAMEEQEALKCSSGSRD